MAKSVALYWYVEVDHVDLSNWCRGVTYTTADDRIDASGFNSTGASEFLSGARVQEIELEIIMDRAANGPHQVLAPLQEARTTFPVVLRPVSGTSVSATNEELRGNAVMPEYSEGATRGDLETTTVTLLAADSTGFVFYST